MVTHSLLISNRIYIGGFLYGQRWPCPIALRLHRNLTLTIMHNPHKIDLCSCRQCCLFRILRLGAYCIAQSPLPAVRLGKNPTVIPTLTTLAPQIALLNLKNPTNLANFRQVAPSKPPSTPLSHSQHLQHFATHFPSHPRFKTAISNSNSLKTHHPARNIGLPSRCP